MQTKSLKIPMKRQHLVKLVFHQTCELVVLNLTKTEILRAFFKIQHKFLSVFKIKEGYIFQRMNQWLCLDIDSIQKQPYRYLLDIATHELKCLTNTSFSFCVTIKYCIYFQIFQVQRLLEVGAKKEGVTYFKAREVNHVKFQNIDIAFSKRE